MEIWGQMSFIVLPNYIWQLKIKEIFLTYLEITCVNSVLICRIMYFINTRKNSKWKIGTYNTTKYKVKNNTQTRRSTNKESV